jgi:Lhr-like helicase
METIELTNQDGHVVTLNTPSGEALAEVIAAKEAKALRKKAKPYECTEQEREDAENYLLYRAKGYAEAPIEEEAPKPKAKTPKIKTSKAEPEAPIEEEAK